MHYFQGYNAISLYVKMRFVILSIKYYYYYYFPYLTPLGKGTTPYNTIHPHSITCHPLLATLDTAVGECFFWYRLTWIVPDIIHRAVKQLCVCVRVWVCALYIRFQQNIL